MQLTFAVAVAQTREDASDPSQRQIELLEAIRERIGELRVMKLSLPPLICEDADAGLLSSIAEEALTSDQNAMISEENRDRRELFTLRVKLGLYPDEKSAAEAYGGMRIRDDEKFLPSLLFRCGGSSTFAELLGPPISQAFLRSEGYQEISVSGFAKQGRRVILVTGRKEGSEKIEAIELVPSQSGESFDEAHYDMVVFGGRIGEERNPGEERNALAFEGIAPVVHPLNPLEEVSSRQLLQILTGEIRSWSGLGGGAGKINLQMRDDGSGSLEILEEFAEVDQIPQPLTSHESDDQLAKAVFSDRKAFGFLPMSLANRGETKPLRVVGSNGAAKRATVLTVMSQDYDLVQMLYLSKPVAAKETVKRFLAFVRSPEGAAAILGAGFVPATYFETNSK